MKPNFIVLIVIITAAIGAAYYVQDQAPARAVSYAPIDASVPALKKQKVPDFTAKLIGTDQRYIIPDDIEGRVVLLNFWASWCAPCVTEFPILIDVAEQYKDGLIFLAVSSDMNEKAVQNFFSKMKYEPRDNEWMVLDDKGAITNSLFQTYMLPETILIDQQGQIIRKFVGVDWTKDEMTEAIDQLLK